ncbi:MAG: hypothetical protein U0163_09730 [Gemmatimonadaceae bacterium]
MTSLIGKGAAAQTASGAHLGLAESGGMGVLLGAGEATHHLRGVEVGGSLDLGWIGSPRLRLVGDVAWFGGRLRSFVTQDDKTYRSNVFDLAGTVAVQLHGGSLKARTAPFVSAGVAVHALSSSFGSLPLDLRYNANRFGLMGAVGVNQWLGSGRQSLRFEARFQEVTGASRWTGRLSLEHHFGSMVRSRK